MVVMTIDYYASFNMWQLQGQKVHFKANLPHYDLDPQPLTPTFDVFILALKSVSGKSLVKFRQQIHKISC